MDIRIYFSVFCCILSFQVSKAQNYIDIYNYNYVKEVTTTKSEILENIILRNGGFSTNYVKAISSENQHNYVSSPISAWLALSMAYIGANGLTATIMRESLNLPLSENETLLGLKELIENLNTNIEEGMKIINKLYVKQGSNLKEQYKQVLHNTFKVNAEERDFKDPNLPSEINNFVAEATNQKIENIFPRYGGFNAMTEMVLLNAVYFKGLWKIPFNKNKTKVLPFYMNGGKVIQVPTMNVEFGADYSYNSELRAVMVEIPYKDNTTSMLIVVPNRRYNLSKIEQQIRDRDINNLMKNASYHDVRLYLPKFRVESTLNLESTMSQMGMDIIFSNEADFANISDQPLKINTIRQKAFVQIDEESTEAAAVTDSGFLDLSAQYTPKYSEVRANHPFLFYILHRTTFDNYSNDRKAVVLFNGRIENPLNHVSK